MAVRSPASAKSTISNGRAGSGVVVAAAVCKEFARLVTPKAWMSEAQVEEIDSQLSNDAITERKQRRNDNIFLIDNIFINRVYNQPAQYLAARLPQGK